MASSRCPLWNARLVRAKLRQNILACKLVRVHTRKFIYFIRLSIKRLKNGQDEKSCYQTYIKSFPKVTKAVAAGAISGHALPPPPSPLAWLFPAKKPSDKQPTDTSVATIATEIAHKGKGCVRPVCTQPARQMYGVGTEHVPCPLRTRTQPTAQSCHTNSLQSER